MEQKELETIVLNSITGARKVMDGITDRDVKGVKAEAQRYGKYLEAIAGYYSSESEWKRNGCLKDVRSHLVSQYEFDPATISYWGSILKITRVFSSIGVAGSLAYLAVAPFSVYVGGFFMASASIALGVTLALRRLRKSPNNSGKELSDINESYAPMRAALRSAEIQDIGNILARYKQAITPLLGGTK